MHQDQSCIFAILKLLYLWGEILKVSKSLDHLINSIFTVNSKTHPIDLPNNDHIRQILSSFSQLNQGLVPMDFSCCLLHYQKNYCNHRFCQKKAWKLQLMVLLKIETMYIKDQQNELVRFFVLFARNGIFTQLHFIFTTCMFVHFFQCWSQFNNMFQCFACVMLVWKLLVTNWLATAFNTFRYLLLTIHLTSHGIQKSLQESQPDIN